MRIAKATCRFCGIDYSWLMSGRWPRGTEDKRPRSSTLCPDCYEKVMTSISEWCQKHSLRGSSKFTEALFKRGLSAQAILAVLVAIDEHCHVCWDGPANCVCMQDD